MHFNFELNNGIHRPSLDTAGQEVDPRSGSEIPALDVLQNEGLELIEQRESFSAEFCSERGYLPLLIRRGTENGSSRGPVTVLANAGGQLANAKGYMDVADIGFEQIVSEHERRVGPQVLWYTNPGDSFVTAANPTHTRETLTILEAIRTSASRIGISLTENWQLPASIRTWAYAGSTPDTVAPLTLEPLVIGGISHQFEKGESLLQATLTNALAYRKDAIENLWGGGDLPLLTSYYLHPGELKASLPTIIPTLNEKFARFDHLVITRADGSGGFGISKVERDKVTVDLLGELSGGETLQIQGYVPLVSSPCVIGFVAKDEVALLHASEQLFSKFGTHSGNMWSTATDRELQEIAPDYKEIAHRALEQLRLAGVFGQVNIDMMITTREIADSLGLTSTIFLREANIRPAGSSIMLRMRTGQVEEGYPVERIHSISGVPLPFEMLEPKRLTAYFSSIENDLTRVVLTNYDLMTETAQLALLGHGTVSSKDLLRMEERLRSEF